MVRELHIISSQPLPNFNEIFQLCLYSGTKILLLERSMAEPGLLWNKRKNTLRCFIDVQHNCHHCTVLFCNLLQYITAIDWTPDSPIGRCTTSLPSSPKCLGKRRSWTKLSSSSIQALLTNTMKFRCNSAARVKFNQGWGHSAVAHTKKRLLFCVAVF